MLAFSFAITLIQYFLLKSSGTNGLVTKVLIAKFILLLLYFAFTFSGLSSKKLIFYKNFGISTTRLFLTSFIMDSFLTLIIIKILNLF
nr:hypothetical protein [Zobellia laminariae]